MDQIEKEFPSISPRGSVDHVPEAYRRAMAEDPYRELEMHAKKLGLNDVAEQMGQLAIEAGENTQESIVGTPENDEMKEKLIKEIISSGSFDVFTNTPGQIYLKGGGYAHSHHSFRNDRFLANNPNAINEVSTQKKLTRKDIDNSGVAEMVTTYSQPKEGRTLIFYETAPDSKFGELYKGSDTSNRPSNQFRCIFAIEPHLAERFIVSAKQDPEIIHKVLDRIMVEQMIGDASVDVWEQRIRPPYQEWREAENGVARMAFFERENASNLSEAEIIEY